MPSAIPRETECQRTIVEAAQRCGFLVHAERTSQNARGRYSTAIQGDAGFVDLIMLKNGWLLAIELKRDGTGVIGPGQDAWLDAFDEVGGQVHAKVVWVPSQMQALIDFLASVP